LACAIIIKCLFILNGKTKKSENLFIETMAYLKDDGYLMAEPIDLIIMKSFDEWIANNIGRLRAANSICKRGNSKAETGD